ncbi:diguanylate cyclase [Striga asiatica]|uniref:Diguanylate cyclase n=1 Tax=Striga asiatica TaxID=4170 RepID=A0A5A7PI86_STRAF|nr:diguanylate cyclase [Striga asiatica]
MQGKVCHSIPQNTLLDQQHVAPCGLDFLNHSKNIEADLTSDSRSESSTGTAMADKISTALIEVLWRESETIVGWMPEVNRPSEALSSDPAMTTTVVVPSPATTS